MRKFTIDNPATRDEVLVMLGMAISGREDFVHPIVCVYAKVEDMDRYLGYDPVRENGQLIPSCIVGVVLSYMGLLEQAASDADRNKALFEQRTDLHPCFTSDAVELLIFVQEAQDGRTMFYDKMPWGEAVAYGIAKTAK